MKKYVVLVGLGLLGATAAWSEGPDTRTASESPAQPGEVSAKSADVAAAEAIVRYRHTLMEGVSKHMKGASMIARGQVEPAPGAMVAHANGLHDASLFFTSLFPESSAPSAGIKSDSKQEIWDKWEDFVAANDKYKAETAKLLDAAQKNDLEAFKTQFKQIGRTCGGCHKPFRVDDDH